MNTLITTTHMKVINSLILCLVFPSRFHILTCYSTDSPKLSVKIGSSLNHSEHISASAVLDENQAPAFKSRLQSHRLATRPPRFTCF